MILTQENYYSNEADWHYMSVSQYKSFIQCEAQTMAKLKGEYEESSSDALLLGSYVHAAIEGTEALELFKQQNPEIFCSTGKNKGELKAEYKQADKMIESVLSDEICSRMLQGEKEVIITAELFGTLWKAKLDVYAPDEGRFTDLKTVKAIREKYWLGDRYGSFVEAYGYTIQMAVYTELERIHSRRFDRLEPLILAVSKEDEPDKALICFDEQMIEQELTKVHENLPRIIEVKNGEREPERCERCRYCRKTKKVQGMIHYMSLLEVV
ncbi:hypothetical protein PN4B1_16700 [Paenibacillus naphthalenovorans]|uniref:PD-(D/E)XK nuclease-like domain-containing protein n=1 Tax=Paenibacillus naphthalenovorans TaxID=162209 RepID=UPI0010B515E6|nr:PD-(D/E)XK nuclease-like domain-containing protein [Paenibacillus naphthalenovorans]GCL71765.1 hypothetical protein PN4B1_16700 [Paenibacillus naphthalenovorans]